MGSVPEIAHYGLHYIPWTIYTASKGSDFNILSAAILHNVKPNDLRISCPLGIGVRQVFSPTTIFMEVVVPTPRVYTLVLLRYVSVPLLITNFNTVEHCLLECTFMIQLGLLTLFMFMLVMLRCAINRYANFKLETL